MTRAAAAARASRPVERLRVRLRPSSTPRASASTARTPTSRSIEAGHAVGATRKSIVHIDALDLVEGTYKLDVAVHTRDGAPYDYHRLLYTFRVKSRLKDVGHLPAAASVGVRRRDPLQADGLIKPLIARRVPSTTRRGHVVMPVVSLAEVSVAGTPARRSRRVHQRRVRPAPSRPRRAICRRRALKATRSSSASTRIDRCAGTRDRPGRSSRRRNGPRSSARSRA